jgi:hypothetical protein
MNRLIMLLVLVALAVPAFASAAPSGTCTPTGFKRDGIDLTAAKIGGTVSGELDASGCDIGVFYGQGTTGLVKNAAIKNAKYFGVVNFRGKVDVKDSSISNIGNNPFDGTQHGVGILFTTEELQGGPTSGTASGTIMRDTVSLYQKGGITVRGAGATAQIMNNTVTGRGELPDIAQNGIQVSFGGDAAVKRNTVKAHAYSGNDEACGILYYNAAGKPSEAQAAGANTLSGNEVNVCVVVPPPPPATCMLTGFVRDGINLTAAKIGGTVSGEVDAAGCDIGIFYGAGTTGLVKNATIKNAKYFGVVNFRAKVDVKDSTITKIGNTPFDGTQHGVGILYTTEALSGEPGSGTASGTIMRNVVNEYQKGGITLRGAGATAQIVNNTVKGRGNLPDIAQNGIQVSFGAEAAVKRNVVTGHYYTGDNEACGILYYQAANAPTEAQAKAANTLSGNELDVYVG